MKILTLFCDLGSWKMQRYAVLSLNGFKCLQKIFKRSSHSWGCIIFTKLISASLLRVRTSIILIWNAHLLGHSINNVSEGYFIYKNLYLITFFRTFFKNSYFFGTKSETKYSIPLRWLNIYMLNEKGFQKSSAFK